MGHVVNPISFRLNKTKFCFNTWVSCSTLRYTPLFLNDISLNKFIYWYLSTFNGLLLRSNLLINNLKILRSDTNILININFSEIIEYRKKRKYINNKYHYKKRCINFLYNTKSNKNIYISNKTFYDKKSFKRHNFKNKKRIYITNKTFYDKKSFKRHHFKNKKRINIRNNFIYNKQKKNFFKNKYIVKKSVTIDNIFIHNNKSLKHSYITNKQINPHNLGLCNKRNKKSFKRNYLENKYLNQNLTPVLIKGFRYTKLAKKYKSEKKKELLKQFPKLLFYLKFKKYQVLTHKVDNRSFVVNNKLKPIYLKKKLLKYKNIKKFLLKTFHAKKWFFFGKFFLYKKNYRSKKRHPRIFLNFFKFFFKIHKWYFSKIFKNGYKWSLFLKRKKKKKRKLLLFLKIFKCQLNNILKCFLNLVSKTFQVNVFILKKVYYANILSKFIQTKLNQGFMLKYLTKKLNYKLNSRHNNILGYKLYYCGRSSKKLRNFPDMWAKGYLGLSNPIVPLEYSQIALWTKKGIVGLKIWLLKKKKIINVF